MDTAASKTPTIPGTPFAGGFYAGRIKDGGNVYAIIVAPKAAGDIEAAWHKNATGPNSGSYFDGPANTKAIAEAGSELGLRMQSMSIYGFDDWYLPSRDELEICYRNLKPSSRANSPYNGDNPSSVPPGYMYTREAPAQTAAAAFQEGGTEAFELAWYWTSTPDANCPDYAWLQGFVNGGQDFTHKSLTYRARAVRRMLVIE